MDIRPKDLFLYGISNIFYLILMIIMAYLFFFSSDAEVAARRLAPTIFFVIAIGSVYRGVILILMKKRYGPFKAILEEEDHCFLAFTFPDKNYTYQLRSLLGSGFILTILCIMYICKLLSV